MGKGDKKTKRGKIIMGTYGRLRPRKKSKAPVAAKPAKKKAAKTAKKTTKKKAAKEA